MEHHFKAIKKQIVDDALNELNQHCCDENRLIVSELMRKSSDIVEVLIQIMTNQATFTTSEILDELQIILLTGKSNLIIEVPDGLTNPGFGGVFSGLAAFFEKKFSPLHKSIQTDEGTQELRLLLTLFITQIRATDIINKKAV